jgi:hypothetical protein
MAAYGDKHSFEAQAANLLANTSAIVESRLIEKHIPATPALVDTAVSESSGGAAKLSDGPVPLQQWWGEVTAEAQADPQESALRKKRIMAAATMASLDEADSMKQLKAGMNLYIQFQDHPEPGSEGAGAKGSTPCAKGPKARVFRQGPGAGGPLPFWGRVVDERVAAALPRAMCMPLGDAGGKGPNLFLDGTSHANAKRNDCAVAWLIPPLKRKRDDEGLQPAAKKPKSEPSPTHEVVFEPFPINVDSTQLVYNKPVLVRTGLPPSEEPMPCIRAWTDWELAPVPKRQAKDSATTFVAR